ncbi:hypothetical protein E2C01_053087 [Portunus trituberculatus]|uniref:Uncharacterized protein n=1 Tax=Portunus trituberculatus TaxID=210409 RepID=A0A5B7GJD6_PORTR|nr:hypothetical protein [Portunus trituberculatus]
MPAYIYSGLHPRDGTIPMHTFFSVDGVKPVVAMNASIIIDGQSLQQTQLEEMLSMMNAFQYFSITNIYKTRQDYDYALLVENLDNKSIPAKLSCGISVPASYSGVIIDYDPQKKTYTVGCGPYIFNNVVSEFSCTDPSSEFPSVQVEVRNKSNSNICDHRVDITCMMDCILKDLPSYTSCSTLHDEQYSQGAVMPLEHIETSALEIPEKSPNHLKTKYPNSFKSSSSSACSLKYMYHEQTETSPTEIAECIPNNHTTDYFANCKSSTSSACSMRNESLFTDGEANSTSCTLMSLEEFEAYKPTISKQEKRNIEKGNGLITRKREEM